MSTTKINGVERGIGLRYSSTGTQPIGPPCRAVYQRGGSSLGCCARRYSLFGPLGIDNRERWWPSTVMGQAQGRDHSIPSGSFASLSVAMASLLIAPGKGTAKIPLSRPSRPGVNSGLIWLRPPVPQLSNLQHRILIISTRFRVSSPSAFLSSFQFSRYGVSYYSSPRLDSHTHWQSKRPPPYVDSYRPAHDMPWHASHKRTKPENS